MNFYTIFECAQLFERLSALQWTWLPSHELEQGLPPESVDALVTEKQKTATVIPLSWDRSARKVKSVTEKIENNLHLVPRRRVRWILEWMRSGYNPHFAFRAQFLDQFVD